MNEEHGVKHLGRLRLTWEHVFSAIVLSGPYRAEAASNDLRLAPHTLLAVLRSQLTAWTILAEPSGREQLIEAAHDCAQDLPVALEYDASAPRSATHLDKQLNATERAELYAEAKNRLFFGIGDTTAFLLASLVGDTGRWNRILCAQPRQARGCNRSSQETACCPLMPSAPNVQPSDRPKIVSLTHPRFRICGE